MGTIILTAAIIGLASFLFQLFWKQVLRFFYYLMLGAIDIARKVITAVRRGKKVVMILYRRYTSGRVTKEEYKEEDIEFEDVPEELQDELYTHEEVIVKKGDIDPTEF